MPSLHEALTERDMDFSSYIEEGRRPKVPERSGYAVGVPIGGATPQNAGYQTLADQQDRPTQMQSLYQSYVACTWVSTCIDVIARTCTAGGLDVVPITRAYGDPALPTPSPELQQIQELLHWVNPNDDIRQLMRMVITDLLIFGDSFTEVVWVAGKPAGLYPLDAATMSINCDEHGMITGYTQTTDTNRTAQFLPREVIHVRFDTPGNTLYGLSPTQKSEIPITIWLFTQGLIKETMRRGDPGRVHVDWPNSLPDSERSRLGQQYAVRNLGAKNIGNLFETKGDAKVVELGINNIGNWLNILDQRRNEILSEFGVPPAKAGVIEAGNLGGGTGTSQDRGFRVNTCGPIQELVLEKFSFALLVQAYGITDWTLKFGVVDWRDDEVIEQIRDLRIRNGSWTENRARADIGEPPVEGGDEAILVDRQNMVLWKDLAALSKANLDAVVAGTATKNAPQPGDTNPGSNVSGSKSSTAKTDPKRAQAHGAAAANPGPLTSPGASESARYPISISESLDYRPKTFAPFGTFQTFDNVPVDEDEDEDN